MALVDERGRLFGRVNVVDAFVAIVVLAIVPLVYGAFVLFRPPMPEILTVAPGKLPQNEQAMLQVTGRNLRPYLRAYVGSQVTDAFLIMSPTQAEVRVPAMGPGTYDLIIYDEAQELARKPMAVTIGPMTRTVANLRVRFLAAPEVLALLKAGQGDVPEPIAGSTIGGDAVLTKLDPQHRQVTVTVSDYAYDRTYASPQVMEEFVGEVRLPVASQVKGWTYKNRLLQVGGSFRFEAADGGIVGTILEMHITAPEGRAQ